MSGRWDQLRVSILSVRVGVSCRAVPLAKRMIIASTAILLADFQYFLQPHSSDLQNWTLPVHKDFHVYFYRQLTVLWAEPDAVFGCFPTGLVQTDF